MDWLYVGLGLAILLLSGDALVKGAVNLSLRFGLPAFIVSLTIVAFGTSAPELLVAINAVEDGAPGLALGNVVGSNTANILLVLGVPALLTGIHTSNCDTKKSFYTMIGASVLFIVLAFFEPFTLVDGVLLLAVLGLVLADQFREARAHQKGMKTAAESDVGDEIEVEGADPDLPWWRIVLFLLLGLIGLPLGADLLVDGGVSIAQTFGLSDTIIGLTLIAVGTSLPELATSVMAALRGKADVALGNVIGSNMFNLLAIIGVTSVIASVPVDPEFLEFDLWVMLGSALLLAPFALFRKDLTRIVGAVFCGLYLLYVVSLLS